MSVLNKRNALLGWATWVVGKRFLKWKATDVVPGRNGGKSKGAVAAALAAAGGAIWFWRRRSSDQSV